MTLAHVCDDCDRRMGDFRFVAIMGHREQGEFCSVTCLNAWMSRTGLGSAPASIEVPKVDRSAELDAAGRAAGAAVARAALAAKPARKCEQCGRVGQRRFRETATGWVCTSHDAAPQAAEPAVVPPAAPAPSEMGVAFQRAEAVKAAPDRHAAAPQARPPAAAGVTARCTDCHLTWNLTGRPLDLAIDMHELKRGHIVQLADADAEVAVS